MKNPPKKGNPYHDSLPKIFLKSGSTVFVILLIGCVALYFALLYCGWPAAERVKLTGFCFVFSVLCSYVPAVIGMFKVWQQQRTLGINWKDRNDHDRLAWERDWYLNYDRGGFILCHRDYIKRILGSHKEVEYNDYSRGTAHCVVFEDVNGKRRTLRFSSPSEEKSFRRWYKKQAGK